MRGRSFLSASVIFQMAMVVESKLRVHGTVA